MVRKPWFGRHMTSDLDRLGLDRKKLTAVKGDGVQTCAITHNLHFRAETPRTDFVARAEKTHAAGLIQAACFAIQERLIDVLGVHRNLLRERPDGMCSLGKSLPSRDPDCHLDIDSRQLQKQ